MLTHGQCRRGKKTREWMTWNGMVGRCTVPTACGYKWYGGRGIKVCESWRHSFENFIKDMGPKPGPGYSIDRLDSNGDYCPENCRWATRKEQVRNTSRNVIVEYKGSRMCLTDLCNLMGMSRSTVKYRLKRGMSIEQAIGEAVNYPKHRKTVS